MKNKILGAAALLLILAMAGGLSQDFEFEMLNQSVVEGQPIFYDITVLNPSLNDVSIRAIFTGPDGTEIKLDEAKNLTGKKQFKWATPFNNEGEWTLKLVMSGVDFKQDRIVDESLDANFNVTKLLSERNPKYIIFFLSVATSMFTTMATYFMVDQKKAKAIKEKVSAMQKEVMAAQRSGDKKKIAKAKQKQSEMMSLQSEMMRNQFKPMIIYMIPLFAVFYFLRAQFDMVPVVELPFRLGFMQFFHQHNAISVDQFGFIAWYFASATWFGSIFRKILGVV